VGSDRKRSDASKNGWQSGLIAFRAIGQRESAMAGPPRFFDSDERLALHSAAGDPLERLAAVVGKRRRENPSLKRPGRPFVPE